MFPFSARYASCKLELRNLVYKKRDQYMDDLLSREILDTTPWEIRTPPPSWKPKGKLVAHLHEHRGAVNRWHIDYMFVYLGMIGENISASLV